MSATVEQDRVIFRPELRSMMDVSNETIRRWMKANKLPAPDVAFSQKTLGWRVSTLRSHGINIAA